jgi:hypothetical protein
MYALLGLVAPLTLLAADRVVRSQGRLRVGLGLMFSLILGLYTHYAYAFVLVAINVTFGVVWLTRKAAGRWRTLWTWAGAHLVAGVAFLPWLPKAFKVTRWSPPDLNSGRAWVKMGRTLIAGVTLPDHAFPPYLWVVVGGFLLLALVRRSRAPFLKWSAVLMVVLPPALIAGLGVYRRAYLKFLMVAIAPLAALLALTWRSPSRRAGDVIRILPMVGIALTLLLLPVQSRALTHLYTDPAYTRDDYREIAARIEAASGPEDAIFLSAPNQWEVFTYYYRGPLPVYPAIYHPTPEEADAWIDELRGADHRQLFVLYWGERESDPHARLERRLATQAYKAAEQWVTRVRVARYGMAALPTAPDQLKGLRLGDTVLLEGFSVVGDTFAPGDIVPLTLFWRADAAPSERYKVFVHLLNAEGQLVSQNDMEPQAGFRPTDTWEADIQLVDRYGVLLPEDLPSGSYALNIGMYRLQSGERLPVQQAGERLPVQQAGESLGDVIALGSIEVSP